MTLPIEISVVVPVYNEEESLPELVEQLLQALRPTDKTFELKIRDDTTSSYPLHIGPIDSFDGININNSNGNVGIGVANPTKKFEVNGNTKFQET